ncbi:hypothetical protein GCM10007424_17450 [Flavobacterium suaedae]|uniref:ABC-type transport auxiliary lipoprotein component domain-containing protein n=2 Tax=Flavobacterium suaedae TaxID=1767027 RepID=A0ABQ1JUC4_9FLAO|nr:hypothetical protein GCM10007424_17450 [Flavobacterium suaedae]
MFLITGCKDNTPVKTSDRQTIKQDVSEPDSTNVVIDTLSVNTTENEPEVVKEKTTILVIQCSNGYNYSGGGYDFNPLLEKELRKIDDFEIVEFSYKKLMGSIYQGVYDKKYAKPIMEKIDADIYIMTRFADDFLERRGKATNWGYELKLLNTKTMEQKISIGADSMESYEELQENITKNIDKLVKDIQILSTKK